VAVRSEAEAAAEEAEEAESAESAGGAAAVEAIVPSSVGRREGQARAGRSTAATLATTRAAVRAATETFFVLFFGVDERRRRSEEVESEKGDLDRALARFALDCLLLLPLCSILDRTTGVFLFVYASRLSRLLPCPSDRGERRENRQERRGQKRRSSARAHCRASSTKKKKKTVVRRNPTSLLTCDPSVARSVLLICAFTSSGRLIHCAARTAC
jgi:hypothetical protein